MIISLPMTSNTAQIYSSLLFKWKAERETLVQESKQLIASNLRKRWWNKIFRKNKSDEDLLKHYLYSFDLGYMNAWYYKEGPIEELTSLLAADKLAILTKTTATFDIPDHLIKHLNKELSSND